VKLKCLLLIALAFFLVACDNVTNQTKQTQIEKELADRKKQIKVRDLTENNKLKSNFKSKDQINFEANYFKEHSLIKGINVNSREGEKIFNEFIKFDLSLTGTDIVNWKCRHLHEKKSWKSIDYAFPMSREKSFPNDFSITCFQPNQSKIDGNWVDADIGLKFDLLNNTNELYTIYTGDLIEFSGILVKTDSIQATVIVKSLKIIPFN